MIRIKNKQELLILREGGKKLSAIMDELCSLVRPGLTTGEIEDRALRLFAAAKARPAFKDYTMPDGKKFPSAIITCLNEEVVHAPARPSRELKDGDILTIDIGLEYPLGKKSKPINKHSRAGGYYTDMSRTVAVGEVGEDVKRLIAATRDSLSAGIEQVRPGNTLSDIGGAIQSLAERAGYSVVRELVGHGVGHEAHEEPQVPNYRVRDGSLANARLKPGMVIAIEPMINMGGWRVMTGPDGYTIITADNSLSAHFEHTVAVTNQGHEILTLP